MKTKILLVIICALLLYNCSPFNNQGLRNNGSGKSGIVRIKQFEGHEGTFLWSHYDATKRGSAMYIKDGKIRILAENSPDAAYQSMAEIAAKTDVNGKVSAELAVKTQRTIAELGKRTAAVNMLRDALYRLNEMYYATVDEKQDIIKQVSENIKTIDSLTKFNNGEIKSNQNIITSLELLKDNVNILKNLTEPIKKDSARAFTNRASTIDSASLENLFKNIIDNAMKIAISESEADKITVPSEANATIKTAEANIKKMELLNTLVSKLEKNLTKEELDKFIKDNLNP